jgi:hypothetical protein
MNFNIEMVDNWSSAFMQVIKEKPYLMGRLSASWSKPQLESKLWLCQELKKLEKLSSFNNVAIIGGWYCHVLAQMLIDDLNCKFICNYDIDEDCKYVSYKFNKRYKDSNQYIFECNNLFMGTKLHTKQIQRGPVDMVINTSCEHMFYMCELRRTHFQGNPLFVLQSTDCDTYPDHINTVKDPDELAFQAHINDVYYMGTKVLSNGMKRFMVIGK